MFGLHRKSAFSLVELSIVLVILGLLTGGILGGQALIRAAEIRSVSAEHQRYIAAAQTFRDKYFAVPGDMTNATAFWGDNNSQCPNAAIANGTPGTCNGNGNGLLDFGSVAGGTAEFAQFWNQLAYAGLVEGNYTGLSCPANSYCATIGTDSPRSKLSNAGWSASSYPNGYAGDASTFAGSWGNALFFGAPHPLNGALNPILKPEEAWNIDTKADDGRPGTGKIIAFYWNNACANAASAADNANALYRLDDANVRCALAFVQQF